MKITDFNLTKGTYSSSAKNKLGVFEPKLSDYRNIGKESDTITSTELDGIFNMYATAAFDDIDALNSDRPLSRLELIHLSTDTIEVLTNAIILQINNLLINGLNETKNVSINSTSSFTSTVENNTSIITSDQLNQDVEDELNKIQYKSWQLKTGDDGKIYVYIGNQKILNPNFFNLVPLANVTLEQDDSSDLTILAKNKAIKLINETVSSSKEFKGTWAASTVAEIANLNTIFFASGLTLENGDLINKDNSNKGDLILVSVPSDDSYSTDEFLFDGASWLAITDNNAINENISSLQNRVNTIEIDYLTNADLPDASTYETKDDAYNKFVFLNTEINSIKNTEIDQQFAIDTNSASREIFQSERADYARIQDLQGSLIIDISTTSIVKVDDNTFTVDLSSIDLSSATNGIVCSIKFVPKSTSTETNSYFTRDSFGDGSTVINTIYGKEVNVMIDSTIVEVSDMDINDLDDFIDNYEPILFEQLPANVAGVDAVARQLATNATNVALESKLIANKKVSSALIQGIDFNNYSELFALTRNNQFVNISLTNNTIITGVIYIWDASFLAISGTCFKNSNIVLFGSTVLYSDLTVTDSTSEWFSLSQILFLKRKQRRVELSNNHQFTFSIEDKNNSLKSIDMIDSQGTYTKFVLSLPSASGAQSKSYTIINENDSSFSIRRAAIEYDSSAKKWYIRSIGSMSALYADLELNFKNDYSNPNQIIPYDEIIIKEDNTIYPTRIVPYVETKS